MSDCDREKRLDLTRVSLPFKHSNLFSGGEFELIKSNVRAMVESLDEAEDKSVDPPTVPPPSLPPLNHTGRAGRPRIEIDPRVLSDTLPLEPKTTVARLLGCSPRTIRRRQQAIERQTGVSLTPDRSRLSDEELDAIVCGILEDFPHYGRSMVLGAMTVHGHNVPESRVRKSIDRVRGAPGRFFGARPIHRRKYFVPAANSLWHHDGQHGVSYSVSQSARLQLNSTQD